MLPNSPSDCHAPFTSPVAQYIWPYDYHPSLAGEHWRAWAERDYALAQQAEFEYLWLRELYGSLCNLHDSGRFLTAIATITPYLNPPTP